MTQSTNGYCKLKLKRVKTHRIGRIERRGPINDVVGGTQRKQHLNQTRLAGTARHEELLLEHDGNDGNCGGGLSSARNLVVMELGSEGGRVMVELVRNIVVRVRQWYFDGEVSGLEVPRGFGVEVKPRTRWDGRENLLQEVIVGVVGVEV